MRRPVEYSEKKFWLKKEIITNFIGVPTAKKTFFFAENKMNNTFKAFSDW